MSSLPPPGVMRLTVRRRVIVHGRVQGVGFRFAVARAAEARAVTGWVPNRADGAVEAVFEGEPEPVESLIRFCGSGPRGRPCRPQQAHRHALQKEGREA